MMPWIDPRSTAEPPHGDLEDMEAAILRTLAYADVFDFALREPELHRYLIGRAATQRQVGEALAAMQGRVVRRDGSVALAGRASLMDLRHERRRIAARTWPVALRYARAVGGLPFVRMVAVTGALAVGNATEGADIDLFVVTAPGRLWLARAATIAVVRFAAHEGMELCPNYFLAKDVLTTDSRDLYDAHELAQMVPVVGRAVYRRLRDANAWTSERLPNAVGPPYGGRAARPAALRRARPLTERLLRSPVGDAAETWERRKIERFRAEAAAREATQEARFGPDRCKGHLDGHAARIRSAYEARARSLGVEPLW